MPDPVTLSANGLTDAPWWRALRPGESVFVHGAVTRGTILSVDAFEPDLFEVAWWVDRQRLVEWLHGNELDPYREELDRRRDDE